jgi:hypothetical protein
LSRSAAFASAMSFSSKIGQQIIEINVAGPHCAMGIVEALSARANPPIVLLQKFQLDQLHFE